MTRRIFAFLIVVIAGGMIVAGVGMIYEPAALITAGVLLLTGLFGVNVE